MGKQRFRLSHMIPNAWFYRLRDMNTAGGLTIPTTHNKKPLPSSYSSASKQQPRNSFCYTPRVDQFYNSPTPTSNTNTLNTTPKQPLGSIYTRPTELTDTDQDLFLSPASSYHESFLSESTRPLDRRPSTSCSCGVISSSTVVEFNEKSYTKRIQDSSGYALIQEIELQKPPPIITKCKDTLTMVQKKEETCGQSSISIKVVKENVCKKENPERKPVPGVKIRPNSSRTPVCKRIVHGSNDHKRQKNNNKKNLASSCCIVKSSFDPQKDFEESMVEMIMENNIWTSKDLEKLLACYLSLNSNDYHDMIIKAFEEIWLTFDFIV